MTENRVSSAESASTPYDVIVAGGGPAGCAAAAAAAREGARTLLLEQTGALGGMATSGLVPMWAPFTDKIRIIYRGLAEEVFNRSRRQMPHVSPDRLEWVPIDAENLKVIYDELMAQYGVEVLFHSLLAAASAPGGTVESVTVANKAGLTAYRAGIYIDGTGDGDLAVRAGAEFQQGDRHGELQPMTHCFKLANVDMAAFAKVDFADLGPDGLIAKIVHDDNYPLLVDSHRCHAIIGPGVIGFNSGHLFQLDATDPAALSLAMAQGRQIARQFHAALQKYAPTAFGKSFLVDTAPLMGVRETRRILGDYVLSVDDYMQRRSFDDEICRNAYFLDAHPNVPKNGKHIGDLVPNRPYDYGPGESHGIPYRCLTPKRLTNVLVAGRCISTDRDVNSAIRVMPVCLATGEAAGTAAALAAAADGNVHRLDPSALRDHLRKNGVYLP